MTIKYTNTIEDLVELQNHFLITSKTLKNQMRFRRFFVPSLILIMLIIISFKESSFGPFILGVVIFFYTDCMVSKFYEKVTEENNC